MWADGADGSDFHVWWLASHASDGGAESASSVLGVDLHGSDGAVSERCGDPNPVWRPRLDATAGRRMLKEAVPTKAGIRIHALFWTAVRAGPTTISTSSRAWQWLGIAHGYLVW